MIEASTLPVITRQSALVLTMGLKAEGGGA
jgi:hypothetical protein